MDLDIHCTLDERPWFNETASDYRVPVSRLVGALALGRVRLPWKRLSRPAEGDVALVDHVRISVNQETKNEIQASADRVKLARDVFIRKMALGRLPVPSSAVLILPASEERFLQEIFRLIACFPRQTWPDPVMIRRRIEEQGLGKDETLLRKTADRLEDRLLAALRYGSANLEQLLNEFRALIQRRSDP